MSHSSCFQGAMISGLTAGVIPVWLNMGRSTLPHIDETLPSLTDGCFTVLNSSLINNYTSINEMMNATTDPLQNKCVPYCSILPFHTLYIFILLFKTTFCS